MGKNNIFLNTFYTGMNPMPLWSWEVQFVLPEDIIINGDSHDATYKTIDGKEKPIGKVRDVLEYIDVDNLQWPAQSLKMAGVKVENFEYYFAGYKKSIPGKPTMNGQLEISFADNKKLVVRKTLEHLLNAYTNLCIGNESFKNQTAVTNNKYVIGDEDFDIIIRLYNPVSGEVAGAVRYFHCFVQNISGMDLDYKGENPIDVNATFNYKYVKTIYWDPAKIAETK